MTKKAKLLTSSWRIRLEMFIFALIAVALCLLIAGCVAVKGEDGQPKLVPGWAGGGDVASAIAPFLPPPWGNILTALAGAAAVPAAGALGSPRVRQALKKGQIRTAVGWKHSTSKEQVA